MKKIIFMFAAALMMVACNNEEIVTNDDVQYVSELKVNFEGDSRVSASHSAAGLKFAWEDGDEIVFNEYDANRIGINIYYVYDASTQTFKPMDEINSLQVGKNYFGMAGDYMSISVKVVDGDIVTCPKLDSDAGLKDIPMITDVFTASADGTIATMHHLVGVVEVPVKLDPESSYNILHQLNLAGLSGLSGEFIALPVAPYFKEVTTPNSLTRSDVLNVTLDTETATSVFIPVLPGTYTEAITLGCYYYDSDEDLINSGGALGGSYSNPRTLVVERGKITKVSEHFVKLW